MNNRNLYIIIGILVVLNIFTVATFWFDAFNKRGEYGAPPPLPRPEHIIAKELSLTPEQLKLFVKSKEEHFQQAEEIHQNIRLLKDRLFEEIFIGGIASANAAQLNAEIADRQRELGMITYKHFAELAGICRPEQQAKLKIFIREVSRRMEPGGRNTPPPPAR